MHYTTLYEEVDVSITLISIPEA